ncbi:MAG TPA: hypothetical protein VHC20_06000 [Candidatus Paceibacterota bacterium]|nr:hypothetical protein [Candidatus Paceibacterota bacterium]
MSSPFAQPSAGGEKFEPKDFGGALLLIYPKSYNPNETTTFGPSTSADVDIVVVDRQDPQNPGQPVIKRNARLFGNLANSVRDSIGSVVLGRLGQVPTNKGNPAWVLQSHSDQEEAQAAPVHAAWQAGQFAAQVQQPQAPQQHTANGAYAPQVQGTPPPQQWGNPGFPPAQQQPPAQQPPQGQPDLWAGQQQYAAQPPVQGPPQGAPAGPEDPSIAALIAKGLPEAQVRAMDPQTRASVLATYGG